MEKRYKVIIWLVIILAVGFLIYYSINRPAIDFSDVEKEELANCLTQKLISLHGGSNCPGCVVQKNMFGEAAKYLIYVDCDIKSNNCIKGLALPYWTFNNTPIRGPAPLKFLKERAGC